MIHIDHSNILGPTDSNTLVKNFKAYQLDLFMAQNLLKLRIRPIQSQDTTVQPLNAPIVTFTGSSFLTAAVSSFFTACGFGVGTAICTGTTFESRIGFEHEQTLLTPAQPVQQSLVAISSTFELQFALNVGTDCWKGQLMLKIDLE